MNILHYNSTAILATSGLNPNQTTAYFSTLIIRLVAFITCIAIVEKKYSIFKTISSTPLPIAPLHHKTSNTCAKKKFKHFSLIIKAFLSFQATKVISVGNKKYNNFSNELEAINQYLTITLIHHYLETTQKSNH
ncbi:hypothetical protein MS2017_0515 [Bathymodiolus thermophilus thioautotrophic gill symbiont]|uniref:Transmembrane protein n=1 Tax=Bathymodiolus thermophilus thioautotrophic gill symbiont TaxID=2360 RepID=A0A3G3IK91_9GAMM|nr:hypothetical protein [Bathymodiolus thermophilus thioautotrophic gill symbiont]AYQ56255.1 hypothetical protein MS2017_0515 [Bathymodiolus thermophilus thioautotrophic gill symbiont]